MSQEKAADCYSVTRLWASTTSLTVRRMAVPPKAGIAVLETQDADADAMAGPEATVQNDRDTAAEEGPASTQLLQLHRLACSRRALDGRRRTRTTDLAETRASGSLPTRLRRVDLRASSSTIAARTACSPPLLREANLAPDRSPDPGFKPWSAPGYTLRSPDPARTLELGCTRFNSTDIGRPRGQRARKTPQAFSHRTW